MALTTREKPIGTLVPPDRAKVLMTDLLAGRLKPPSDPLATKGHSSSGPNAASAPFEIPNDLNGVRLGFTGSHVSWLSARRLVANEGGLPPHALLDRLLTETHYNSENMREFQIWAREVLVYPVKSEVFTGSDVIDFSTTNTRDNRPWVFPGKFIPKYALNRPNVGLFVLPEEVQEGDSVVIIPKVLAVIENLPVREDSICYVSLDSPTRIPQNIPQDPRVATRQFIRVIARAHDADAVRPLSRGAGITGAGSGTVDAAVLLGYPLEATYVKKL